MSLKELAERIWEDIKEHSNRIAQKRKKRGDQPWQEEDNFRKEYSLPIVQRVVITYDGTQHIASSPNISHRTLTAETTQEIEEFLNEYMLKWGLPEEETEVDGGSMKAQLRKLQEEQGITPEVMKRIVCKHLVDVDPEVEKRLRELREAFYKAALREELSEEKARAFADSVLWWIKFQRLK